VKEDISEILPNEIGVKEMDTDNSTIAKIKILCPEVKAVHFFLKNFASLKIVRLLLNEFPTIQEISFNCPIWTRALLSLPFE
jgi:hypothetical protein